VVVGVVGVVVVVHVHVVVLEQIEHVRVEHRHVAGQPRPHLPILMHTDARGPATHPTQARRIAHA